MKHNYFTSTNFDQGKNWVVGSCNGVDGSTRWEEETKLFVPALNREIRNGSVIDYGCGVGRMSKALLDSSNDMQILGVDSVENQISIAESYLSEYIKQDRFKTDITGNLNGVKTDAVICLYVLQHIPAIDLRDSIREIHKILNDFGSLICCSSKRRMAVRFDVDYVDIFNEEFKFVDDGLLGVDIAEELDRMFEYSHDLFTEDEISKNYILSNILNDRFNPHFARVYRKRILK